MSVSVKIAVNRQIGRLLKRCLVSTPASQSLAQPLLQSCKYEIIFENSKHYGWVAQNQC